MNVAVGSGAGDALTPQVVIMFMLVVKLLGTTATTASNNVAVGRAALMNSTTTASNNTAVGSNAVLYAANTTAVGE